MLSAKSKHEKNDQIITSITFKLHPFLDGQQTPARLQDHAATSFCWPASERSFPQLLPLLYQEVTMAEWLQQLDPSKLVLGETVSSRLICDALASLNVAKIGLVFCHLSLHITHIQLANISIWDVCSRKH